MFSFSREYFTSSVLFILSFSSLRGSGRPIIKTILNPMEEKQAGDADGI